MPISLDYDAKLLFNFLNNSGKNWLTVFILFVIGWMQVYLVAKGTILSNFSTIGDNSMIPTFFQRNDCTASIDFQVDSIESSSKPRIIFKNTFEIKYASCADIYTLVKGLDGNVFLRNVEMRTPELQIKLTKLSSKHALPILTIMGETETEVTSI